MYINIKNYILKTEYDKDTLANQIKTKVNRFSTFHSHTLVVCLQQRNVSCGYNFSCHDTNKFNTGCHR